MSEFSDLNFNKFKKGDGNLPKMPKLPNLSFGKLIFGFSAVLVVIFLYSTIYTIEPDEVGVLQRFGKYQETTDPGLHFKLPFGIDRVIKVKITRVHKLEFGFRTTSAGVVSKFSTANFLGESLMLTGDLNIANVQWIVQYQVKNPYEYLFKIRNVEETIRNLSESVMRSLVGDRSVDEVIVIDRQAIAIQAKQMLQESLDRYGAGIKVNVIKLQNVNPPKAVQAAFNEVNSAKQEEEQITNQAWQDYNKIIPEAKGMAKQDIEEAKGYAINKVNRAEGEAYRFNKILAKYKGSKSVTRKRMYIETMQEVLPKLNTIYIVDESQKGLLPLLNLTKEAK